MEIGDEAGVDEADQRKSGAAEVDCSSEIPVDDEKAASLWKKKMRKKMRRQRCKNKKKYVADYSKPVSFVSIGAALPDQEIIALRFESKDLADDDDNRGFGFGGVGSSTRCSQIEFDDSSCGWIDVRQKNDVGCAKMGIGKKLLEKMGYNGGGLGKTQQGIVAPIKVSLRPKNMGMGYKKEKPQSRQKFIEKQPYGSIGVDQKSVNRERRKWWRKARAKKRKGEAYIAAQELLMRKAEEENAFVQEALEMSQPLVTVLADVAYLNAEDKVWEYDIPMPKLQQDLGLTADYLAKVEMQNIERGLRNERVELEEKEEVLEVEVGRRRKQPRNVEEIISVLDLIGDDISKGTFTLDSLAKLFNDIQRKHPDGFKLFSLPWIACSFAVPSFVRVLQGCNPLHDPSRGLDLISLWKDILQSQQEHIFQLCDESSTYAQLIMEVGVPALRISGLKYWDARYPEPMIRFVQMWEKLLPPSILQAILDEVVFPKLAVAVDWWDPGQDIASLHHWISPWFLLLGQRSERLHHTIRQKLGCHLQVRHINLESAYDILSPWKIVFNDASWENVIASYVVAEFQA